MTALRTHSARETASFVYEYGLACLCGTEATDTEIQVWLSEIDGDPEPQPWSCGPCCPDDGAPGPHDAHGCVWDPYEHGADV